MSERTGFSHVPVLLNEVLSGLNLKKGGAYVDGTVGGGGHSLALLQALSGDCELTCIDRDVEALAAARQRLLAYPHVRFVHANFHDAKEYIKPGSLDGALLDLGVSSWQLDSAQRGFSYHEEAPLDMRMDQTQGQTAADWLNQTPEKEMAKALYDYADERWAARIAKIIVEMRAQSPFKTTKDLVVAVDRAIPKAVRRKDDGHPARRAFQAVRIAVNEELAPLTQALDDFMDLLKPGGRLCVITFHSIEDRLVKRAFVNMKNPCVCPVNSPICVCGKQPTGLLPKGFPAAPSQEEIEQNPRARSARLRVVEKIQ